MQWHNLKKRWAVLAATALLCGGILSGGALAATDDGTAKVPSAANHLEQAVKDGKLSRGEADVLTQIGQLRQAALDKLKSDAKTVIEQAVKDGKLTQEQADRLLNHTGRAGHGPKGHGRHGQGQMNLTPEQLKAKLAEKVKAGQMTQEQADQILKKFSEMKSR